MESRIANDDDAHLGGEINFAASGLALGLVSGAAVGFLIALFVGPMYWFYLGPAVGAVGGVLIGLAVRAVSISNKSGK